MSQSGVPMSTSPGDPVWSVGELASELQAVLREEMGPVRVRGEVSRFTPARSGHWYLTLKDSDASIDCVMFRGNNRYVRFQPQVGDRVVVTGDLDLYAPRGQLNLVARRMLRDGEGDLQARIDALKRRLGAEGLFDPDRKRPLPPMPQAVGVATSPTGAAFQDILRVTGERFPGVPILLAPCRVQGVEAPRELVLALATLQRDGRSDVIIVGRGGGSAEDLMAFNDESVVRAIAECTIPIVSAVGHETDVSIADLAADVRAATPSHAAELVVPEREALLLAVGDLGARLRRSLVSQVGAARERLALLRVPPPAVAVLRSRQRVERASDRLYESIDRHVVEARGSLALVSGRLHALSPHRVLGRGYALARTEDGRVVSQVADAAPGERLRVEVQDGAWWVRIEQVDPK